jgi:1,4-alpha-glucan branching enzyme
MATAPSPHPGMGAVPHDGGCTFRVWAPNAQTVWVAGDFSAPAWDAGKVALARDDNDPNGPGHADWSAFVPGVAVGAEYRFVIRNPAADPDPIWRMDPYGRDATSSTGNSIVCDSAFDWGPAVFQMPHWNEMVIYQLHVGTFNARPGKVGTFADALPRLDYLRDLGVNAIQLLPAEDFDTDTSMGYNPSLPFAIDDAYGRSKAVQEFVKQAHARGLAVLFDVVYNHFGPEMGPCLWRFDGWGRDGYGGIYLYNDGRAACPWGERNRPDFGRGEVRQYLRDNATMWLHEYRADGLRFDSTVNVHRVIDHDGNDRGGNGDGWDLLSWINDEKNRELPWNVTIAEDLQNDDAITQPTGQGGAGFDAQWDPAFRDKVRGALVAADDRDRDVGAVASAMAKDYNGAGPFQRIVYVESHDEAKDGRLPEKIWWGHATSWAARKRSTLGAAVALTAPGIPMIFMGAEFLEFGAWGDRTPLDWGKVNRFGGIVDLYRDLIRVRRNWYDNTRGLRGPNVNVFHVNPAAKVLAYHRWMDGGPGDDVVVVANFSAERFDGYAVGFPRPGTWYLRFNSDWRHYADDFGDTGYDTTAGGDGLHGLPFGGNVGLGPYSAIVLSQ